jgi:Methyltransferase domain
MDKNYKLDLMLQHDIPQTEWEVIIPMVQDGLMIELGVSDGLSFTEICKVAYPRKVYGFDWFHGLPEEWSNPVSKGIGNRLGKPPDCPENGEFVIGLIEETLRPFMGRHPNPVAFVHFDLDLYSSTAAGLHFLSPWFETGTILAFDEIDGGFQHRNFTHEQKAFREWLEQSSLDVEMLGRRHPESWVMRLI